MCETGSGRDLTKIPLLVGDSTVTRSHSPDGQSSTCCSSNRLLAFLLLLLLLLYMSLSPEEEKATPKLPPPPLSCLSSLHPKIKSLGRDCTDGPLDLWQHHLSWPVTSCLVHTWRGLRGRYSQAGKMGLGLFCGKQRTYLLLGCLSHSTLSPSLFGLVFFLVIKTSSSFRTPYTQLGVSVYTGRQGFMSQRHTRSLGAATNRCWKCPLWPVYHSSTREQRWGCNPLKGWVCVLKEECYQAE